MTIAENNIRSLVLPRFRRSLCQFRSLHSVKFSCSLFCMKQTFNTIDARNLSAAVRLLNSGAEIAVIKMRGVLEWLGDKRDLPLSEKEKLRLRRMQRGRSVPVSRRDGRARTWHLVNQMLQLCLVHPELDDHGHIRWIPDARSEDERQSIEGVRLLVSLYERGLTSRLKRCPACNKWFQGPEKKEYHSLKCRKMEFNRSPAQLKWRREYQKDYMRCTRLVEAWSKCPIGTPVIVRKDDGSELRTKTRSAPWRLREGDGRHIAAMRVEGISEPCPLERVSRPKDS